MMRIFAAQRRKSAWCPRLLRAIAVKAGAFPMRLGAEDWTSGETVWLLDVIAEDARQATSLLASFRQLAGERVVKIHPMVGRMIESEVLEKLRVAQTQGGDRQ